MMLFRPSVPRVYNVSLSSLLIVLLLLNAQMSGACPFLRQQHPSLKRQLQGGCWNNDCWNGGGGGGGMMGGAGHIIQLLLDNHEKVDREVTLHSNGTIVTRTFSDESTVAGWLQEHVAMMAERVENNLLVRPWDPFFVALFERSDEYDMAVTNIPSGVEVNLEAFNACGQALIEDHTAVVSLFVDTGRDEASKEHAVPGVCLQAAESPTLPPTIPETDFPTTSPTANPNTDQPTLSPSKDAATVTNSPTASNTDTVDASTLSPTPMNNNTDNSMIPPKTDVPTRSPAVASGTNAPSTNTDETRAVNDSMSTGSFLRPVDAAWVVVICTSIYLVS